jgi:hypothetical protein
MQDQSWMTGNNFEPAIGHSVIDSAVVTPWLSGALLATLLLNDPVAQHPEANLRSYNFRSIRPIFNIASFTSAAKLSRPERRVCMHPTKAEPCA